MYLERTTTTTIEATRSNKMGPTHRHRRRRLHPPPLHQHHRHRPPLRPAAPVGAQAVEEKKKKWKGMAETRRTTMEGIMGTKKIKICLGLITKITAKPLLLVLTQFLVNLFRLSFFDGFLEWVLKHTIWPFFFGGVWGLLIYVLLQDLLR
jgi:hypothetical protein